MHASELREAVIARLDQLSDDDLRDVLNYVDRKVNHAEQKPPYDREKDPVPRRRFSELPEMTPEFEEEYLRKMSIKANGLLPPDYDPDNDPLVGFISGPSDLSERTEEILEAEFGLPKSYDEDE